VTADEMMPEMARRLHGLTLRLHGGAALDQLPDGRWSVEVVQTVSGKAGFYLGATPELALTLAERRTAAWPKCPCGGHEEEL
jgi:hypothetical protein